MTRKARAARPKAGVDPINRSIARQQQKHDELTAEETLRDFADEFSDLAPTDRIRRAFPVRTRAAEAVVFLLERLNWSGNQLAISSGIPQSQLAEWLSGANRSIGADEVARITWALAGRIDGVGATDRPSVRVGRSHLDFLLHILLRLAGHSSGSRLENVVWRRAFGARSGAADAEPLKVGYIDWPPLTGSETGKLDGLARSVTDAVCKLLGFPLWEAIKLLPNTALGELRARSVAFIAPVLLDSPGQKGAYSFTGHLRALKVEPCVVIHQKHLLSAVDTLLDSHIAGNAYSVHRGELIQDRISLIVPQGDIVEASGDIAFPPSVPRATVASHSDLAQEPLGWWAQTLRRLIDSPTAPDGRVRVLVTTLPTAFSAVRHYPDTFTILQTHALAKLNFRLAFAVHPHEPMVRDAIDDAMRLLHETIFDDVFVMPVKQSLVGSGFKLDKSYFEDRGTRHSPR